MAEAEALLGDRLEQVGFAKGLYFGLHLGQRLPAYPHWPEPTAAEMAQTLRDFCQSHIDPDQIDRQADIPREVIDGLGRIGVLGACLPTSAGGRGFSQVSYCRLLEILGGHCGSTALFVNAHHSIGPRAVVLFGTPQQQQQWLPKLATGQWISAFALTEPEAGSDAANVQSTATPTADGRGFLVNGQKRWITNGSIAQVLTVMARTPAMEGAEAGITALLVTPDMPGFEVLEARMDKCGVRGTATSRLAFRDMFVPRENVLGQLGKGLKVALTVLDFGRTTFGASCTGAARFCLQRSLAHANRRVQFQQTLGSFELVKQMLADMAAATFAMESATYQTAALIDSQSSEYMVETAMLKVFATDRLWTIVNDTIQIHGGLAYFRDQPYERMMRDARINLIGEGANDVLRVFIALVGMRDVGLELKDILEAILSPWGNLGKLGQFASKRLGRLLGTPAVAVRSATLQEDADRLGRSIAQFANEVERLLRHYQESILDRQYHLARIADSAIELYVSSAVLNRLDSMLHDHRFDSRTRQRQLKIGRYYLETAARRIRQRLAECRDNSDPATTQVADLLLADERGNMAP